MMKKNITAILLTVFCTVFIAGNLQAGVEIGIHADQDGIKNFHLAIGEHFQVSVDKVEKVRKRSIPDEEIPVAFFIAERADVPVWVVVDLRAHGKSWMEISLHFGLTAEAYYVKFDSDPGPPYGKAWGHFKNKPRKKWKDIHLTDIDIINSVNLTFVSARYGYAPKEVAKLRKDGHNFVKINHQIKNQAKQKRMKEARANSDQPKKSKPGKKKKGKK